MCHYLPLHLWCVEAPTPFPPQPLHASPLQVLLRASDFAFFLLINLDRPASGSSLASADDPFQLYCALCRKLSQQDSTDTCTTSDSEAAGEAAGSNAGAAAAAAEARPGSPDPAAAAPSSAEVRGVAGVMVGFEPCKPYSCPPAS